MNGDLADVPDTMDKAIAAMEKAVLNKAEEVGKMYATDIKGLDPDAIRVVIKMTKGQASEGEMYHIADLLGIKVDTSCGDLTDDTKVRIANSSWQWLENVFSPTYENTEDNFVQICDNTSKALDSDFQVLTQAVTNLPKDAFANLAKPPQLAKPGTTKPGGSTAKPNGTNPSGHRSQRHRSEWYRIRRAGHRPPPSERVKWFERFRRWRDGRRGNRRGRDRRWQLDAAQLPLGVGQRFGVGQCFGVGQWFRFRQWFGFWFRLWFGFG